MHTHLAMKTILAGLIALIAAVWGWELSNAAPPPGTHPLWLARQQGIHLTGLLSIGLMSLGMWLATRPTWPESFFGGMDRIYRTHKWAGILGIALAAAHWLVEMSDDILKATIGREGRLPKEKLDGLPGILRDLAKDMGEWAIYALLLMLVITLWKRFPYRGWRFLHHAMPVLYLMLAFHAALLAPASYWSQPAGLVLALLLTVGSLSAGRALLGNIGRRRTASGLVIAIERPEPEVTRVDCRLDAGWPGHRPGQFALVNFGDGEGHHPFTIASADRSDGTLSFQIKALGDYTRRLPEILKVGQPVRVEGPYGRFDLNRRDPGARQIWIAGGIGVTPFLAWLEALQNQPNQAPTAELHYCTRDSAGDSFVPRLQALCASLPGLHLRIHDARRGERLDAAGLGADKDAEIWFCGPSGLAQALRQQLARLGQHPRLHQEAFEMR